jgi:HAD superfamily hydrolase (TIGR01509 family)
VSGLVVFFDIGGTLVDSPDIFETITRKLVGRWPDKKTYDLAFETYHGMINAMRNEEGGHPFKNVGDLHAITLTFLARQYGYRDVSGQARDISVDAYARKSTLFPETKPILGKLLKNGVRMIIASDNDREILAVQMAKHGLGKYFVDSCISETARAYKPTQGFVSNLKKYVSNDPDDCYFIGDSWVDVESGRRLGIKSVLIDRRNAASNADADYVIRDLNGLIPILGLE